MILFACFFVCLLSRLFALVLVFCNTSALSCGVSMSVEIRVNTCWLFSCTNIIVLLIGVVSLHKPISLQQQQIKKNRNKRKKNKKKIRIRIRNGKSTLDHKTWIAKTANPNKFYATLYLEIFRDNVWSVWNKVHPTLVGQIFKFRLAPEALSRLIARCMLSLLQIPSSRVTKIDLMTAIFSQTLLRTGICTNYYMILSSFFSSLAVSITTGSPD